VVFKQRCRHTGVVNFFTAADPLLAAGSIVERAPSRFVWHCHLDDARCGAAGDAALAEAELRRAIAQKDPQQEQLRRVGWRGR
jgi:hypothetical protein